MTVFHHPLLNRTRATSTWSDELSMIEFAGVSGSGQFFPTASRGLLDFCSLYAEALVCRLFSQLAQKLIRSSANASNTHMMAGDCDFVRSETRGHKRFKHTLAPRPFLAR